MLCASWQRVKRHANHASTQVLSNAIQQQ